ncbi:MAG: hypothetical protein IMW90_02640 [Thermogemmatispora sp.]|uniref:Uncharacterized protein n=1 Tax=Thermogemmatispora aurantia TaxID=2045279 RepID=A0A5J4K7M7_9CHLR|nr:MULTISPECIES: hypothetical protein [Thermogemmatispora]MBE3564606.1 hypothetical protein [Thermogemmatispora sp.]GER82146.1 hypothetical protein KTAU_07840 [Thermogemmatispora aurantia]
MSTAHEESPIDKANDDARERATFLQLQAGLPGFSLAEHDECPALLRQAEEVQQAREVFGVHGIAVPIVLQQIDQLTCPLGGPG